VRAIHESLPVGHCFKSYGYKTYRNDANNFTLLKTAFCEYLKSALEKYSGLSLVDFELETYHKALEENDIEHHSFIKSVGRRLPNEVLPMDYINGLIEIANADLNNDFRIYKESIEFRVVRPGNPDNNALHRDHWFPYFLPLVNVYLPLAGSHYDSAMRVVPLSHEWPDEDVVPTFTYEESAAGKNILKMA